MSNPRLPNIIDIEASGFGADSYPIEIGVALSDGSKYCSLIRPLPHWTHWDAEAERTHRLSRALLEAHGKPADEVAAHLNRLLRGSTAYSDGWVLDQPWLNRLFHDALVEREFSFSSLEMILSEAQMATWHPTQDALRLELGSERHRASFDAHVIQETYRRTLAAAALSGSTA